MENFMSKFMRSSIFSSIALAILGVFLFFQSELTIVSIAYIIGAILVGIGIAAMIKYIANLNKNVKNELDIIYGTVTVVLGIIVISNPKAIASIIPFVLGLIIVISSATKLQYGLELRKSKSPLWSSTVIISLITLLCGVMLVINPFAGATFITKVVGILLLVYAILDIISTVRISRTVKSIFNDNKQIEEKIADAVVIEDNTSEEKKAKKKRKNKKDKEEK
jgi:uncharacterized membrane protein HdeD (DUF308 family)